VGKFANVGSEVSQQLSTQKALLISKVQDSISTEHTFYLLFDI